MRTGKRYCNFRHMSTVFPDTCILFITDNVLQTKNFWNTPACLAFSFKFICVVSLLFAYGTYLPSYQ